MLLEVLPILLLLRFDYCRYTLTVLFYRISLNTASITPKRKFQIVVGGNGVLSFTILFV
jgi:hypothetical protein